MEEKKRGIEEIEELQAKHREQLRENREKVTQRKQRTRRLIKRGGLCEGLINSAGRNAAGMTDEEFLDALQEIL